MWDTTKGIEFSMSQLFFSDTETAQYKLQFKKNNNKKHKQKNPHP